MGKSPKLLKSVSLFSLFIAVQLCARLGYSCAHSFPSFGVTSCSHVQLHLLSYGSAAFLVSRALRGLKFLHAKSLALLDPLSFLLLLPYFLLLLMSTNNTIMYAVIEKSAALCFLLSYHMQICCPLEYCKVNGWILPRIWQSWERWEAVLLPPLLLKE